MAIAESHSLDQKSGVKSIQFIKLYAPDSGKPAIRKLLLHTR